MNHAFSPEEAQSYKQKQILKWVFDAWNEMISNNLDLSRMSSTFKLGDLKNALNSKSSEDMTINELQKAGYLDLEEFYRASWLES